MSAHEVRKFASAPIRTAINKLVGRLADAFEEASRENTRTRKEGK